MKKFREDESLPFLQIINYENMGLNKYIKSK